MTLFRVASATRRTVYVVTHDVAQKDLSVVQQVCRGRWKIEQFHREAQQGSGLEKCHCRLARLLHNPIGWALFVWVRLEHIAYQRGQTIYQVKYGLLEDYWRQQRKVPSMRMALA